MCKSKFAKIRLSASVGVPALIGLSMFLLPTENAQAQAGCTPSIGDAPTFLEARAHVGDTVHITRVDLVVGNNTCQLANGTNWLIYPNNTPVIVTAGYTTLFGTAETIFCPGTSLRGCVPYTDTYTILAADVGRNLSFTRPRSGEVATSSGLANTISILAATEADAVLELPGTFGTGSGNKRLTILTPCISITKECAYPPTPCGGTNFPYGADIAVRGTVSNCSTGAVVAIGAITVVDSVIGTLPGSAFSATTSSGRPFAGSLTNGESVNYAFSYPPTGNLCGPFSDTIRVCGTDDASPPLGRTVCATNSAICAVCTSPCIDVTKTCIDTNVTAGTPVRYSFTVRNCGTVPLRDVVAVDDSGTPSNPADDITTTIGDLAINQTVGPFTGSIPTTPANCTSGFITNTVRARGTNICNLGQGVTDLDSCRASVECPGIRVYKQVVCDLNGLAAGGCEPFNADLTTQKSARGVRVDPANCPLFCYRLTVTNTGNVPLTLTMQDDSTPNPDLNMASCLPNFPVTLPVGGSHQCVISGVEHCLDTVNVVTGTGVTASGITVTARDTNTVTVAPIHLRCTLKVLVAGAEVTTPPCLNVSTPYTIRVCVTNDGASPLQNVTVFNLGGLAQCLPTPRIIGNLAVNAGTCFDCPSFTCLAPSTNDYHVGVSGEGADCNVNAQGQRITATNSCDTTVCCSGSPKICVTKEVVCELPTGCAANWSHFASAVKSADDAQCPSFCYRVRVTNCGDVDLVNVTVTDTIVSGDGTPLSFASCIPPFPTTLAKGQTVECVLPGVKHCVTTTDRVDVSGASAFNTSDIVRTNDTATVAVHPINVTCDATVNGEHSFTIPCDGQPHFITNEVQICNPANSSQLPIVAIIDYASVWAVSGCTNFQGVRFALDPGQCTNLLLCVDAVTCPTTCGIAFTNSVHITATVDLSKTNVCSYTRTTTGVVTNISVSTECEAEVLCEAPNACRVTGGGRQDAPDLTYPDNVRYVTHGGQVGAPVGNKICVVTEEFYLGNPCIHGRWTHVRHDKGGLQGNFHARYYDTLDCACLDTNTTVQASGFGYNNLVYGPGTVTEGVCNADDHKVAGPQPRPAPANKIVFTGVGDWADPNGRRAPRATLFRVDIEDRSEPGGSHPHGSVWPPDRYRIRIWVLSNSELAQLKGGSGDRYLLSFRNAIAACIGLTVQDGATVPNGTAAFGVRAPDIDDGGELERGNHQIHPSIKNCDPLNPTGPGLPPHGN